MYVWYQQCEVRFVGVCCECECRHLLLTAIVAGKMVAALKRSTHNDRVCVICVNDNTFDIFLLKTVYGM